jgi:hypothetical protein
MLNKNKSCLFFIGLCLYNYVNTFLFAAIVFGGFIFYPFTSIHNNWLIFNELKKRNVPEKFKMGIFLIFIISLLNICLLLGIDSYINRKEPFLNYWYKTNDFYSGIFMISLIPNVIIYSIIYWWKGGKNKG